jgi:hypothetical protein
VNGYPVSYHPLVEHRAGKIAAARYGIPSFVDGSCRREPDFESEFPSISALCRGRNFAPRLRVGDTAAYMTIKRRWGGHPEKHWRLTAVLRVHERFQSHEQAAAWYIAQGLPLPSNCMVDGNPPVPFDQTAQGWPLQQWDAGYRRRAHENPVFLATVPLFLELERPPIVTETDLEEAFGWVPNTLTPPTVPEADIERLLELVTSPERGVAAALPQIVLPAAAKSQTFKSVAPTFGPCSGSSPRKEAASVSSAARCS